MKAIIIVVALVVMWIIGIDALMRSSDEGHNIMNDWILDGGCTDSVNVFSWCKQVMPEEKP
jgi:hypothetical protein